MSLNYASLVCNYLEMVLKTQTVPFKTPYFSGKTYQDTFWSHQQKWTSPHVLLAVSLLIALPNLLSLFKSSQETNFRFISKRLQTQIPGGGGGGERTDITTTTVQEEAAVFPEKGKLCWDTHPGICNLELTQYILGHIVLSHRVHNKVLVTCWSLTWPVLVTLLLHTHAYQLCVTFERERERKWWITCFINKAACLRETYSFMLCQIEICTVLAYLAMKVHTFINAQIYLILFNLLYQAVMTRDKLSLCTKSGDVDYSLSPFREAW